MTSTTTGTPGASPAEVRLAGLLYLVIIVCGIWSEAFVRATLFVPGDAAATAANLIANETTFRLALVTDTIMALADVALAVLLYRLFRTVSETLAILSMVFRLVQMAIVGSNLLNHLGAIEILQQAGDASALSGDQLAALAQISLGLHGHGYDLGLIFFGVDCLIVGWLVVRSGFLPKAIGVLMAAAGAVYLAGSYLAVLAPSIASAAEPAYVVPLLAELAMGLWLVLWGTRGAKGPPELTAGAEESRRPRPA